MKQSCVLSESPTLVNHPPTFLRVLIHSTDHVCCIYPYIQANTFQHFSTQPLPLHPPSTSSTQTKRQQSPQPPKAPTTHPRPTYPLSIPPRCPTSSPPSSPASPSPPPTARSASLPTISTSPKKPPTLAPPSPTTKPPPASSP